MVTLEVIEALMDERRRAAAHYRRHSGREWVEPRNGARRRRRAARVALGGALVRVGYWLAGPRPTCPEVQGR